MRSASNFKIHKMLLQRNEQNQKWSKTKLMEKKKQPSDWNFNLCKLGGNVIMGKHQLLAFWKLKDNRLINNENHCSCSPNENYKQLPCSPLASCVKASCSHILASLIHRANEQLHLQLCNVFIFVQRVTAHEMLIKSISGELYGAEVRTTGQAAQN